MNLGRNCPRTTAPTLGITHEQAVLSDVAQVIGNLLASGLVLDSYGALPGSDTHWRIEEGYAVGSFVVDGVHFTLALHAAVEAVVTPDGPEEAREGNER